MGIVVATSFFGYAQPAEATNNGITAQVYNCQGWNAAPPRPCYTSNVIVNTTTVPQIDFQWGSGPILSNRFEDVEVKFTGYLMSPVTKTVTFYAPADDGTHFTLNGTVLINDWVDKGGGGSISQSVTLQANVGYPFTFWYYENGGGANVWLYWNDGSGDQLVPSSVFYLTDPTPLPPSLNAPTNLSVIHENNGVTLSWTAPTPTEANTAVERYAVSWSTSNFTTNGWGIATGNVGSATALNTSVSIPYSLIGTDGRGKEYQFKIRADNDSLSTYSSDSNIITLYVPLSPPTISLTAGNNSIQVSVSHQDANTWFYQILTSQQGCSNPYDGQTLNTEGHPSSFTINNLQNDCLYQIKVANWTGQVNLYASATATPIYIPAPLPFTPQYTINENDTLTITAPENKVIDSINAWYGNPNDGNFGLNVSSQLTQQFTNSASANLSATNTVFGDPVPGVGKILIVSVTYKDAPQPEPTPTSTPTVTTTPEPSPSPSSPEPTTSPSPQPSPEPSPQPQTPPQPPVEPSPPSPQPPTPEPPPVRPPDPVVVPPVVEPTPEPDPQPEPEPEVPVEPEQPIDQTPIDTPDSQGDTELDPVVAPEDPTPIEDQLPVQEDPVQDSTETQDPQETKTIDSQTQDDSSNTIEEIIQQEVTKIAEKVGLSEKDAELLQELVKSDLVIAQAVEQFNERAAENVNAPMPYTLADVATEIQAEQIVAGLTEAFTDPAAAFAGAAESFAELANFAGDLLSNPAEALASLGSDMTDDQREKAQEVIIPVIIVSQVMNAVANILSARRI